ncbi:MAG: ABC transporter substrate-binding protein [Microthrixaceae bacterium]|nr:ABC transporter substrate-binding protein [Microthrixaceae bacterium]
MTSTTRRSTDAQVFGTLESPCGKAPEGKTVTIKAEEAGRGTDRLYIGVGNDRTADAQPGMNKELWDTTLAFVAWCNEQGGVAGIPLDPIDIDGRYFHVEEAMTTACSETFALVGGGLVFDNQVFSGKDGSDFHKCRLIAVPGFAVSTDFAEASGVIQPLPNPAHRKSAVWLQDVASLFPEEVAKTVAVYGEGVTSIAINRDQIKETAKAAVPEMKFLDDISYKLIGQDFSVIAQKVIDSGATALTFVGDPVNYSALLAELKNQGWDGPSFVNVNEYDQRLFLKGEDVADNVLIRSSIHMFEEANEFPAMQQLLDIVSRFGPESPTVAALSVQSFSAGLLFAQSVKDCVEGGSGEISRVCVFDAAKKVDHWDAGGLHADTSPAANEPPSCSMLISGKDGKFIRRFPEEVTKDRGFHCDEDLTVDLEGDLGTGRIDPSSPY